MHAISLCAGVALSAAELKIIGQEIGLDEKTRDNLVDLISYVEEVLVYSRRCALSVVPCYAEELYFVKEDENKDKDDKRAILIEFAKAKLENNDDMRPSSKMSYSSVYEQEGINFTVKMSRENADECIRYLMECGLDVDVKQDERRWITAPSHAKLKCHPVVFGFDSEDEK